MRLFRGIRNLFRGEQLEAELDAELRGFVEMLAAEKVRCGIEPAAARRQALIEAGGVEQVKEQVRDVRWWAWWGGLWQDVRYAARGLRKSPGFTTIALLSLALGIGANAAIFGVFYAVLVRPLPYAEPGRLVAVGRAEPGQSGSMVLTPEFAAWRLDQHAFTALTSWNDEQFNVTGAAMPERVVGASVTDGFLAVLGVHPAMGHELTAENENGIVITHELWQRQFGSDPTALGRVVLLNGKSMTVIGVLPYGFQFPGDLHAEILVRDPVSKAPDFNARQMGLLHGIGRLRPGVSARQAAGELTAISARYEPGMPAFFKEWRKNTRVRTVPLQQQLVGDTRPVLLALLGAVGLLLAIACVNVANLQLSRATVRRREIGLRSALGASRGRLARLLIVENLVLAACAGAAGSLFASALLKLLPASAGLPLQNFDEVRVGWSLGAAAFALSTVAGLLVGLVPALLAPRLDLNDVLKSGALSLTGGRRAWVRPMLVLSQVALALVLLLGSGLLLRSLEGVLSMDVGYRTDKVLMAGMRLSTSRYEKDAAKIAFADALLERVRGLPGVEWAAIANTPPMVNYSLGVTVETEGRKSNVPVVIATPDYFRVFGLRLLRGRLFTEADGGGSPPVAVVTSRFGEQVFPGVDPLGKQVVALGKTVTIVGVVGDVRHGGPEKEFSPEMIVPERQLPTGVVTLAVRTKGDPAGLEGAIRPAVWSVDKEMPVYDVSTMEGRLARAGVSRRTQTVLLSAFGLLALLLSAVGIYGVGSEAVSQRTREIGLRMALGAEAGEVVGMVMGRSFVLAVAGVGIGSGAGLFLMRYLSKLLFQVKPNDAVTFAVAAVVLLAVAMAAAWVPARRAARIDPVAALRCE